MINIQQHIQQSWENNDIAAPQIFNFSNAQDAETISALFKAHKIQSVTDDYAEQQCELFAVNNPQLVYAPNFKEAFDDYYNGLQKETPAEQHGAWVYYPWLNALVHVLHEKDFWRVRTARNRNLINEQEQDRFYNAVIGIGGLSVGNSVATAIALQGGGKYMKLADFDTLALSNTNRIRAGVQNLGLNKAVITARQIYELNPYAHIELFTQGITPENIDGFFNGSKKLDIVIDELDNLAVKYLIREQARKNKIPVVMGADNGDNAVIDIERYDLDENTPFFQGRMGEVSYEMLLSLDKFGIGKMITKHVGAENVTERMQQSLLEMGKTIVSWPQLGGAALLNGCALAYMVRKILNRQEAESNRSLVSLDEMLVPSYNSETEIQKRKAVSENFKKNFGL